MERFDDIDRDVWRQLDSLSLCVVCESPAHNLVRWTNGDGAFLKRSVSVSYVDLNRANENRIDELANIKSAYYWKGIAIDTLLVVVCDECVRANRWGDYVERMNPDSCDLWIAGRDYPTHGE